MDLTGDVTGATRFASLIAVAVAMAAGCAGAAPVPRETKSAIVTPTASADPLPMPSPAEYAERPISAEAGAEYFLRAGGGDPYATGMAYPVFLALMEAYPDRLGRDWAAFAEKFGFYADPEAKGDPRAPPVGFHLTVDPDTRVPWLVGNCQMCHAERLRLPAGDVVVAGLGNKSARVHEYASVLLAIGADASLDARRIEALATKRAAEWGVAWAAPMRGPIVRATIAGMRDLAAKRGQRAARLAGALPGRMATIESFAIALEDAAQVTLPPAGAIGWAKVPDVVGFPYRETFSYDASGYGSPQALVLEANFLFGTRPAWYLSHAHIATSMYLYLRAFRRALPYPAPIDAALAARGAERFDAACAKCHGSYVKRAGETRVIYRERVIPVEAVGTDPARAEAVTPAFVDAANDYPPTRGYTRVRSTGGYVPPVLLDVWARGLYGHAGQWPSLDALATPPGERPRRFVVDTAGAYDLERVGVRYEVLTKPRARKPTEYLYDGDAPGLHVGGHPFLSDLPPADRRAVIEHLKTL